MRSLFTEGLRGWLLCGLVCLIVAPARAAPGANCGSAPVASVDDLVQCVRQPALMKHLAAFQRISDRHPGADGHGNRDTLSAGYAASIDYVAGLMRSAGYLVTVQAYPFQGFQVMGNPRLAGAGRAWQVGQDWQVARLSGSGAVSAPVQAVGDATRHGCMPADFAGFVPGRVALLEIGDCELDTQVENAQAAHASALILYNRAGKVEQPQRKGQRGEGLAFEARLQRQTSLPVVGVASHALGLALQQADRAGQAPQVHLEIHAQTTPGTDYNLIADSPLGDAASVVVLEGHLDAIYGAGILDNASGSATMLEVALAMAKTPTRHQLRYIWFGGEELGLFGSGYYTRHLPADDLAKIVFDIDADVTGTPNYAVLIADPGHAHNVDRFPPNVVPASQRGNQYFADYFASIGVPSRIASFGNSGTDSNAFSLVGIPNTGVLTQQDCCKSKAELKLWGGYRGNYEGKIPSRNGGCVDRKNRWCDDIANINPDVLEFVSKSVAYVTYQLANDPAIDRPRP
jgi:hypothetical protein